MDQQLKNGPRPGIWTQGFVLAKQLPQIAEEEEEVVVVVVISNGYQGEGCC